MQNRREVNQDGLRPFALCAVNCKKGSNRTCGGAAAQFREPRQRIDVPGPNLPFIGFADAAARRPES